MSKLDNFKKFVSNHPEFADYVKKNNVSWQSFYELYDLYGEDDEIWKKYIKDDVGEISIKGLLNTLKKINIDSILYLKGGDINESFYRETHYRTYKEIWKC